MEAARLLHIGKAQWGPISFAGYKIEAPTREASLAYQVSRLLAMYPMTQHADGAVTGSATHVFWWVPTE